MEYVYGALLLHKSGQPVNEENLKKVISSTGAQVDDVKIKVLVASLKDVDIDKELETAMVAAPTSAIGGAEDAGKEEEKKEEKKSEAAEGLSALFG